MLVTFAVQMFSDADPLRSIRNLRSLANIQARFPHGMCCLRTAEQLVRRIVFYGGGE